MVSFHHETAVGLQILALMAVHPPWVSSEAEEEAEAQGSRHSRQLLVSEGHLETTRGQTCQRLQAGAVP